MGQAVGSLTGRIPVTFHNIPVIIDGFRRPGPWDVGFQDIPEYSIKIAILSLFVTFADFYMGILFGRFPGIYGFLRVSQLPTGFIGDYSRMF